MLKLNAHPITIYFRQYMVLPFTIEAHMDKYGDPMMHDIIVMVGNPGAHWYTIIIDNRVRQVCTAKCFNFIK